MSRLRIFGAICVAASLGLGLLASVTAPPAAAAPLVWGACDPIHGASKETQCATIRVPRDYANPGGPTIAITVSRLPARDQANKRGVLFGNPGGPGGDAIGLFTALAPPAALRDNWDLIAVQPRGLLGATPVECGLDKSLEAVLSYGKSIRDRCEKQVPGYTRTLTTEATARDIEETRKALGVNKVSLYGLSYGTFLMSTYATLFPDRTDRLVLDSSMNPDWVWNDVIAEQTPHYKARVNAMMAWIAQHDNVYHLGSTPLAVYTKWSDRVTREAGVPPSLAGPPAQVGDVPPGIKAFARQYIDGVNLTAEARAQAANLIATLLVPNGLQAKSVLYSLTRQAAPDRNSWPYVAALTAGLRKPQTPPKTYGKILANGQNLQSLILCNENQVAPQPALTPAALYANLVVADLFSGAGLLYQSGLACAGAPPVTRPVKVANKGLAVQPLQIDSVDDPQTPYGGALVMQRTMRSHLITVGGGDHGQFGRKNKPLDDAIVEYLSTGTTGLRSAPQAPIVTPLLPPQGARTAAGVQGSWS